jgi:hypothetical protein
MHVIFDSADRDRMAALVANDSAEVGEEPLSQLGNERTTPLFRGENHVKGNG